MDKFKQLPINFVVLHLLGLCMLALGLHDWWSDTAIVPLALQFSHYDFALVVTGTVLIQETHSLNKLI